MTDKQTTDKNNFIVYTAYLENGQCAYIGSGEDGTES